MRARSAVCDLQHSRSGRVADKAQGENIQDGKPDKEALVGELQKSLPIISGTLNNCTFNFNV